MGKKLQFGFNPLKQIGQEMKNPPAAGKESGRGKNSGAAELIQTELVKAAAPIAPVHWAVPSPARRCALGCIYRCCRYRLRDR